MKFNLLCGNIEVHSGFADRNLEPEIFSCLNF